MTFQNLLDLPSRTEKPRKTGLTCVIDSGLSLEAFRGAIDSFHPLIDVCKLGWGTGVVAEDLGILQAKIKILKGKQIKFYFGGTFFELAWLQNRWEAYLQRCDSLGTHLIEVSNGTVDMSDTDKSKLVEACVRGGFTVLSEVGYKDQTKSEDYEPWKWIEAIQRDIDAGAAYVITEARESGTSGICRPNGDVRIGLIGEILHKLEPEIHPRLIFEAPNKELQVYFIKLLGPNVNVGNIALGGTEVIGCETLRLGLRSDTLMVIQNNWLVAEEVSS